jgi:large subunit ribosomal protein L21
MYAVIELGGRQWKVEPGTRLDVNRLAAEVGGTHTVERVLLAHDGQQVRIGRPYVEGAKVVCEVVAHRLGPKVISYHFRRRENWRKTVGHRQPLSRLVVKEVQFPDGAPVGRAAAAKSTTKTTAKKPAAAKKRAAA